MGQSSRDEQAEKLNNELSYANFNVDNRFANYRSPYSVNDMRVSLNDVFGRERGIINDQANSDIAAMQQGTASRLASQGITSGSIYNNAISQAANNVNKNRYSALSQLGVGRLNQETGLMQYGNQDQFRNTSAAQQADFQNMGNRMNQYGMRMNNLQNLDSTTWLDDVLSGLNAGANLFGAYNGYKGNQAKQKYYDYMMNQNS